MHIFCYYLLLSLSALTSCTVSISQVHTSGHADDIIDTSQPIDYAIDANADIGAI